MKITPKSGQLTANLPYGALDAEGKARALANVMFAVERERKEFDILLSRITTEASVLVRKAIALRLVAIHERAVKAGAMGRGLVCVPVK